MCLQEPKSLCCAFLGIWCKMELFQVKKQSFFKWDLSTPPSHTQKSLSGDTYALVVGIRSSQPHWPWETDSIWKAWWGHSIPWPSSPVQGHLTAKPTASTATVIAALWFSRPRNTKWNEFFFKCKTVLAVPNLFLQRMLVNFFFFY